MYTVRQSVVTDASPVRDDYTKNPCRTSAILKSYLFIYTIKNRPIAVTKCFY